MATAATALPSPPSNGSAQAGARLDARPDSRSRSSSASRPAHISPLDVSSRDVGHPPPSPSARRYTPAVLSPLATSPPANAADSSDTSPAPLHAPLAPTAPAARSPPHASPVSASPVSIHRTDAAPPSYPQPPGLRPGVGGQLPTAVQRRMSTDRRVRSEALPIPSRRMSMVGGKRVSAVTGGYESSTDEDEERDPNGPAPGMRSTSWRDGAAASSGSGNHLTVNQAYGRRRAQSLISSAPPEFTPSSPARRPRHRQGSGTISPGKLSPGGPLSRASSDTFGHPRSSSMRSVASHKAIDLREIEPIAEKPKRTSRERKRAPLAASLGLGASPRQPILSADQIQDLLGDADVSSAMQLMSKPTRRLSTLPPPDPTIRAPPEPTPLHPFLVSAPPALTNGDWPGRDRTISVSSSTNTGATPLRNVTPATRRPRTGSVATMTDSDGGHVPFTHYVPPILQTGSDIEEADEIEPPPTVLSDAGVSTAPSANGDAPQPMDTARKRDSRRISGLFGLRRKREASPQPPPPSVPPAKVDAVITAAHRQKEREAEMKRAELERRDAELAQERQYRALMQAHAHPEAQRRAQRCATHLDAYYSLIHDGLEHPPKVNPLAVIRWARRVEEQKEAKAKWEAANEPHHLSPSPAPNSLRPTSPFSERRRSSHLGTSPLAARSVTSHTSKGSAQHIPAPGWHYTLDDVQCYAECSGRIDFFIPPVPEPAAELERPMSNGGVSVMSEGHRSQPSVVSSVEKKDEHPAAVATNIVSHSTTSLVLPSEEGNVPLSRATSIDAGSRRHLHRHRPNQSTTGLPTPLQALRGQFEKLGTAARRNISLSNQPSPHDDERQEHRAPVRHTSLNLREGRETPRRRAQHETTTSDDEHHHFRSRLFGRQRRIVTDSIRRQPATEAHGERRVSRSTELRNLEQALQRERILRDAQAKRARRTEQELETEERLRQVEEELYTEREQLLLENQRRLERADASERQMDFAISHYLTQLDSVRTVFRSAADVDISFANLDELRRRPSRVDDGEEADSLAPLRSDSDVGYLSPSGRRKPRKQSSIPTSMPAFAYGLQAWPRRSTVDPTLGVTIDPLRRVELCCEKARDTLRSMGDQRANTTRKLQDMVTSVNQLIEQKDAVRAWAKAAMARIAQLRAEKNALGLKIKGGVRPRMWRASDVITDIVARSVLSMFSYGIRVGRGVTWVRQVEAGWLGWTLLGGVLAMIVVFYFFGAEAE